MEKILKADLTTEGIEVLDYEPKSWGCYGRGLALKLVASSVPHDAGRYSPENAIALVPGILTGCKVASCCRVTIASKRGKGEGLQVCNVSGNLPQKMASLSIAGLLICGKSTEKNAVLHIGEDSAEIIHMPELERKDTGTIVERLKKRGGCSHTGSREGSGHAAFPEYFFLYLSGWGSGIPLSPKRVWGYSGKQGAQGSGGYRKRIFWA